MFGAVSVSGLMLMICVLMPGAFGGGDIKFMVPVGLFLGLEKTVAAWVLSVFLGALWVVAEVLLRWWNTQNREGHKATCRKAVENLREMTFPFGPALCIGSIATLWWG